MDDKYIVVDDSGREYVIPDIKSFHQHLLDFHADEGTIHEENGFYFTVTAKFRQQVEDYLANEENK